MRKALFTLIFLACVSLSTAAQPKIDLSGIKQQIIEELLELKKDLNNAKTQLDSLISNNQQIKAALADMENWGLLQQEEKEKYYNQAIDAAAEVSSVRAELDKEKALRAKMAVNYARVKNIMGCLSGVLMVIFVLKLNNSVLGPVASATLPQLRLLSFIAPVAGFALGYMAVYLYF